jgi:hypothetical protein
VNENGPGREYIEALAGELRVGWRYRRRVLAEIAAHLEDGVERERRLGAAPDEAERLAIQRLGPVGRVAEELDRAHREGFVLARVRMLRILSNLGAALVVACASLAGLATGDSDGHLGLEAAAAITAAMAFLLVDTSQRTSRYVAIALGCVVLAWTATTAALVSDGELEFCALTALGVGAGATLVYWARRAGLTPRRGPH